LSAARPAGRSPASAAFLGLALALAAALAGGRPAAAQAPSPGTPDTRAEAIARELNCPVCQGYDLLECPLEVCAQMRDVIRQRLAAGEDPEAIKAAFVADYGPQVLNAPPPRGFFLLAWLLPIVALAIGGVFALTFLARARPVGPALAESAAPSADPATAERLEELLSARDDR